MIFIPHGAFYKTLVLENSVLAAPTTISNAEFGSIYSTMT